MRKSLRIPLLGKMLALLLAVTVLPLLVVGAMSIRRGNEAVKDLSEQHLELVATTTASRLDGVLAQAQRVQAIIATTDVVVRASGAPAPQRPELLPEVERWLRQVVAADPDLALACLAISTARFASLLAADDQLALRVYRNASRTLAVKLMAAGGVVGWERPAAAWDGGDELRPLVTLSHLGCS